MAEMEKTIDIGGKEVRFRASGATPRHYRNIFGGDMLVDMARLADSMDGAKDGGSSLPVESLEVFENIAFIMAWHAAKANGEEFPDTPEEWLDEIEVMSIYNVLPELISLWGANQKTIVKSKKK